MVDDQIDEFDLLARWISCDEELVEGGFGGSAIEANQGAEEKSESFTDGFGVYQILRGPNARLHE